MPDIADLGIRIDSSPATKAAKELDALTVSATRAEGAAQDLAATSRGRLSTGMSAGGQQSRMMAMQLSQVAQQASATGNWIQALAIQLPDMAMGFGAVGVAAGVLASVTLPLLASMFGDTGEKARDLDTILSDMTAAVDAFTASSDAAAIPADELAAKYGRLADEAKRALDAIAAADQLAALQEINTAIGEITGSLLQTIPAVAAAREGINARQLADDFDLSKSSAQALAAVLRDLENAKGLDAQVQAATRALTYMDQLRNSVGQLPAPLQAAYDNIARIVPKAAEVNAKVGDMRDLLASAAGAADMAAGAVAGIGEAAAGAYGAVADLASQMWSLAQAKAAALAPGKLAKTGDDGRGGQRDTVAGSRTVMPDQPWLNTGGGGGGGGGSDPYADSLNALIETLRTEREIEDEWYQENLTILQDRRAQEILGKQEHDAALIALHEEYQRRIAEIDANAAQQRISDTANLFGALASVAQAGGQKTAKLVATFQAIEGTVNAYGAAIKALNTPGLTVAGRFAAYASVLAAGLKGVAAIRAAGGVGGGGGAGLAAGGVTSQPTAGQAVEYRVYGIDRDAQYSGAFWEKVWNGLFEEGKRRGVASPQMVFMGGGA